MKKIAQLFISISLLLLPVLAIVSPTVASAAGSKEAACGGVGGVVTPDGQCAIPGQSRNVESTIKTVIQILGFIVGVVSVIMIIVGGIKYVVSSGDANAVGSAKNTIMYSVVGLTIALLAEAIARFVFTKASS